MPAGTQIDSNATRQLAALGALTFDIGTWHDNGDGTGTVNARLSGQPGGATMWTVDLTVMDGTWRIAATIPATTVSSSSTP
jgi:hypothetical protein